MGSDTNSNTDADKETNTDANTALLITYERVFRSAANRRLIQMHVKI